MSRLIRRLFDTVHQVPQRPTVCAPRRPVRRATDVRARLLVQALEDRAVPANFPVSNSLDAGAGSLRQAILDANAAPGADTITFDAGVVGPIVLTSGELAVTDDLTITGPGAAGTAPTLVIDGNALGRVFNLTNAAAVGNITLQGLIVQNGLITTGDGAGIFTSNENVTLDRMIVRNNVIAGGGADSGAGIGVASSGNVVIQNSTVSGNTTAGPGGGIYFYNNGSLLVENSTFSGNASASVQGGAGIYFYGTVGANGFTVRNSTISGNSSGGSGGGIVARAFTGAILVQNSTIVGNTASFASTADGRGGGGIAIITTSATSALTVQSSIVSGNTANAVNNRHDIAAAASITVNITNSAVGVSDGLSVATVTAYNDAANSNRPFGTALLLGPLLNNGGPTETHALQPGSPAIDAGANPASLLTDQRGAGFLRLQGAAPDIGAFEVSSTDPSASGTFSNVTAAGATTYTFQVTYTDPSTNINVSSLGNGDVRVTGPGGFSQPATFVSATPNTNAPSVTATYSITAPGGVFNAAANGTYTVAVEPNQVFNTAAPPVAVPPATLGSFQVLVAQTFTVTNLSDAGTGSLRDAVTRANAQPGTADTIAFAAGLTGIISLTSGELAITDSVTINGPGAGTLTVRRDAAAATQFRIFNVDGPGVLTVNISGLTVSGGNTTGTSGSSSSGDGAGLLLNGENLTLENMVISGNTTATEGGGIGVGQGGGFLTVRNTTVSGNLASAGGGGGIYFANGGGMLLENSTVSGNTTATFEGGGFYFFGTIAPGGITIRNSTISGNSAGTSGGGVALNTTTGTVLIQNSTITNNTATATGGLDGVGGGGVSQTSGTTATITIVSSIVAGNTNPAAPDVFSLGTVNVNFSAIGSDVGFAPSGTSGNNLAAGAALNLGPLANNGGPTQTHALGAGSAAINAGSNPANLTSDQRGFTPRVVGAAADIGSFEVGATAAAAPTVADLVVNGGGDQRSEVRSVVVTFSEVVNFAGGNAAAAFTLSRIGGGGNVGLVANVATVGTQTVVTLTFNNTNAAVIDQTSLLGGGATAPSLADGRYQLTIADGAVTSAATGQALDGDANGTAGGAFVSPPDTAGSGAGRFFGLYRLFGDATGNGLVDLADLAAFRGTFNQTGPNPPNGAYLAFLDADNSNTVDLADLSEFRSRFNQNLFTP